MYPVLSEQLAKEHVLDLARLAQPRRVRTHRSPAPLTWAPGSIAEPTVATWRRATARALITMGARIARRAPDDALTALGRPRS